MNQTPIHELEILMSRRNFLARIGAFERVSGVSGEGVIYRYYAEYESTTLTMPRLVPLTRVFFKCLRIGLGMPSGRSIVA